MTVLGSGLGLALYILLSYLVGRLIATLLGFHVDALVRAGCPLIGAAAMGIELWIFGVVHVPWFVLWLVLPWLVAAVVTRRRTIAAVRDEVASIRPLLSGLGDLDPLTAGLVAFTVATLGFYLLNLLAQPLVGWDAIAMWLFKAKVFFDSGSVDLANLPPRPISATRHLDYPPLFSLMVATAWVLLSHVDDMVGKSIGFMFLISGVAAVSASLLPLLGTRLTAMFALLMVALPALQTSFVLPYYMGYADYAIAVFMLLSLAHLYRSVRLGRDVDSGLAFKNEGLPFVRVIAVVLVFGAAWGRVKERETPSLLLVSVAAAGFLPVAAWQVYTRVHGFNSDVLSLPHPAWTIGLLTSRARTIASFFFHLMNRNDDYPWLAAAWIVATVLTVISRYWRLTLVWAALTAQGLTYGIALLTTPNEVTFELNTAADRLVLQLVPSLLLLLGLALRELPHGRTAERGVALEQAA
ncbi:MAG: hypothetical protein E6I13_08840 [Chloroflexi bacterium]|nr:MAG: hypothetical protein E6I13_08840 [Chloroflexota bacterium]